jgi:subtilisin family serine protease
MGLIKIYYQLIKKSLYLILTFLISQTFAQQEEINFAPDEIYVQFNQKLKKDSRGRFQLDPGMESLFSNTPVVWVQAVFPNPNPEKLLPGMDRIFRIKLDNPEYLYQSLQQLSKSSEVVYAEKVPLRRMFEISNDPFWNSQYQHSLMQLDSARSIHTGDSSVVIAVIDGGVNYLHEDLRANIWINFAEDVDGDGFYSPADIDSTDADNNGFIDDVIGWDFIDFPGQGFPGEDDSLADNNPMDFGGHGTHCAGDAAAVTNNGLGVASPGGDCRIMCIRAGMLTQNGLGIIYHSVEGIYYAANNGAKVISMSYGGPIFSSTEQFAIDYAHTQGVICIAAAGNDNSNTPQYPANYNHVVAVAATDQQDHKADFSNYGNWIDVSAPGVSIFSTTVGGNYGISSGTSMSTPIVAGLVGLTAAMFPQYTNNEVVDRILANSDNIDAQNPLYTGQLGAGRVNAFKSLDKVIRVLSFEIKDSTAGNANGRLDFGETAELILKIKNTYETISGVTVTIKSLTPVLSVSDSIAIFGNMNLGRISTNVNDQLIITVGMDTSISNVSLRIMITADGGYHYEKDLVFPVGQRDLLIVNDDETNGSSKIGYYTDVLDSIGKSFDIWNVQAQGVPGVSESGYPVIIWYTGEATQNVLAASEQIFFENYLNDGGRLFLTGQNIGYDLVEQQNGSSFFENYLRASYVQNSSNDYSLEGILGDPIGSGENFIILGSGGANNQNSPDVITAISPAQSSIIYENTNQLNQAAITYSGSYKLVYFAFGWEGINDLGQAKRKAVMERVLTWLDEPTGVEVEKSNPIVSQIYLYPNYPNPFNPETTIHFRLSRSQNVEITIYNNLSQSVKKLINTRLETGEHRFLWNGKNNEGEILSSGIYYFQIRTTESVLTRKMLLIK